jgi:predicted PurR-regulated permease PerM/mRNA-degrading endonuclease toxin of MazEF toxin-antitoxin module
MSHPKPISVRPLPVAGEKAFYRLAVILMVVGVLYWARAVFLPLGLAVLFAFALTPVAGWLERRHLGRVLAALLSTVAVIGAVVGVLVVAEQQTERLILDLREDVYQKNIARKLEPILDLVHRLDRVEEAVNPEPPPKPAGEPPKPTDPPTPVLVKQSGAGVLGWLPSLAQPVAEVGATLLLVAVLTVFMLVQRETTRDRLLGLARRRQLTMTTRALEAAAHRVGRFLLLQAATNTTMGLIVGVGLALIGVPYPVLWGMLTAGLRFLPYAGIWLSALFPFGLALAVFPGWGPAILVIALYGGFDALMTNVVEPLLFGHGTGVSSLALLMAAVFWAFLWGPVGLLLAVPLTVCVVVLGEYVPSLEFLRTLLGEAPDVDTGALFFHRALVGDYDGAAVLIGEMADTPLAEVYGQVLLPALAQAKTERNRGDLDFDKERRVYRAARSVLTGVLAARRPAVTDAPKLFVIGCAAEGAGDRLALGMLRDLVTEAGGEMAVVPATKLAAEIEGRMRGGRPFTVCVAALAPGGLSRSARLCEQVRAVKTGVRVVVGRWGAEPEAEAAEKLLRSAGATQVTWTLSETLKEVVLVDNPGSTPGAASRNTVIV